MTEEARDAQTPDINSLIAGHVRRLRAESGLTLESLAAKCDVSRSMLSLVERGESSPTAVVLEKIAAGLGVPLATLFDDINAEPDPVSRAIDRSTWRDPESGYVRRNLSPGNFPSPLQLVEVFLPAGARVAYETGARELSIQEQIWVLEGSIDVSIGNTTHRLGTDDCLATQLNQPITFRNHARTSARYIVAVATDRAWTPRR